jgi:hypothetical protein
VRISCLSQGICPSHIEVSIGRSILADYNISLATSRTGSLFTTLSVMISLIAVRTEQVQ